MISGCVLRIHLSGHVPRLNIARTVSRVGGFVPTRPWTYVTCLFPEAKLLEAQVIPAGRISRLELPAVLPNNSFNEPKASSTNAPTSPSRSLHYERQRLHLARPKPIQTDRRSAPRKHGNVSLTRTAPMHNPINSQEHPL